MGLAEGPTLADRIEQGSIHRDLKPANMKLRPDGLVLDFGLRGLLRERVRAHLELHDLARTLLTGDRSSLPESSPRPETR